jgi:putative NADH-flavin reductase
MKVVLFGASGNIGSAICGELLDRGHEVTAVTRSGAGASGGRLSVVAGDVTDTAAVSELVTGHDAVISAVGPRIGVDSDEGIILGAARSLIAALPAAGVRRLIVLGGAGSLETAPGIRVVDDPHFPAMWKANALAQTVALGLYLESEDLNWTFVSPPALIEHGERTGSFRVGGDQLLVDGDGVSRITIPDFAIAFADELEKGASTPQRITVAY